MENQKLELRLYGLVPYNISPIQQGIQYGHAKDEYTLRVIDLILSGDVNENVTTYVDWLRNWKTYIILNGGTTNTNPEQLGSLNTHYQTLKDNDIFCTAFYEPDLCSQLTGVDFIVDERVFNKEKYPDFDLKQFYGNEKLDYKWIFEDPFNPKFPNKYALIGSTHVKPEWDKWVESIGGRKNLFLRIFLKNFRLA
jgi:hypothetical protein